MIPIRQTPDAAGRLIAHRQAAQSQFQALICGQDGDLDLRGSLFQQSLFLRGGDTRCPVELIPESGIERGALRLAGGDAADIAQGSLDQDGGRQVALLLAQAQRLAELRHFLVHLREARDVIAGASRSSIAWYSTKRYSSRFCTPVTTSGLTG